MDDFSIIRINGSQYRVCEGDEIFVDHAKENKLVAEVLLYSKGGKVEIGTPVLKNVKAIIKIIEGEHKGKKLHVMKFRSKSRYRKKIGFRPVFTKVKIQKISH